MSKTPLQLLVFQDGPRVGGSQLVVSDQPAEDSVPKAYEVCCVVEPRKIDEARIVVVRLR